MEEQRINQSYSEQQTGYEGYGYEGNPFEQMDQDMCKRCHRRKIDRSENPESVLCKDCREELIKLKVPPVMIGVGVGVAVLVVVCIAVFVMDIMKFKKGEYPLDLSTYLSEIREEETKDEETKEETEDKKQEESAKDEEKQYRRLEGPATLEIDEATRTYANLADIGKVITALDGMLEDLVEDPDNVGMAVTAVDVAMKYSYPDYAAYVIDTYLTGKSAPDDVYERIMGYIDELNIYYDTYDTIDEIWNTLGEEAAELGEDAEAEEYQALLQVCHDEIEIYLGMEEFDQAYINYELAYICQDEEERIQHLEDCIAINPNYYDASAQLGTYYRRHGDLEKAREILERSYDVNNEDYALQRSLATLELVEDNLAGGLIYAESAYESYPEGTYVVDTYLIALLANGEEEQAKEILQQWEEQGYEFDDDFYSFMEGNMTLEQYYIGD